MTYNPENLIDKSITLSYYRDGIGEDVKIVEIDPIDDTRRFHIQFEKCPDLDEEDFIIWTNEQPDIIDEYGAYFTNLGGIGNFYLKLKEEQEQEKQKLEYNKNMKTTVKELSDKLGVDVVYINGFLKTLEKLGKATVVGKVERPAGTKGKPSNIYEIADGVLD